MTQLSLSGCADEHVDHGVADYWPTPAWLADRMVEWADLRGDEAVVEPSAGDGAIVRAVVRAHPGARVTAVEANPERRVVLFASGAAAVESGDWPTVAAGWGVGTFDVAVANPPFSLLTGHLHPMVVVARRAVVLLPLTALAGGKRYDEVWRFVRVTRLAVLVSRPRFGGSYSPATDYCVAEIERGAPGGACALEWW